MKNSIQRLWRHDTAPLLALALVMIAVHCVGSGSYGYFRDELYYIACSKRLAWGYVDQPPLSIALLAATRAIFDDSAFAIRLPAAAAGGLCVVMVGLLARDLGGSRRAQWLAALAYVVMGTSLTIPTFFSMNVFDHLFWLAAMITIACLIRDDDPRLWLVFGLVIGLGLLNKLSIGFFVFAIVAALVMTDRRRLLWSRYALGGAALAGLLFLPHLLWQLQHGLPTLEFVANAQRFKIVAMSPTHYLAAQVLQSNPATLPVWICGLAALLAAPSLNRFRAFGLAYLIVLGLFLVQQAKPYYLAPAYPMLLAAAAVVIDQVSAQPAWRRLPGAVAAWLAVSGLFLAPYALPLLSPEAFVRYARAVGLQAPRDEQQSTQELPQYLADRLGWTQLAATVARVYNALPSQERERATILTGNYGEAGALELFGLDYGLPQPISGHNNYWLWGPGPTNGDIVIAVGIPKTALAQAFESITDAAVVAAPQAVEDEAPVFVCRGLRFPLGEAWAKLKRFI